MGNRILRNVNSSSRLTRIICVLSGSDSCLEWYSELPCDDSPSDSYSEVFDMASIQGSGMLAGVSCSFVPQNFCSGQVPDKGCCKLNGRNYTSAGALPQV